jgi:hypothetical protein
MLDQRGQLLRAAVGFAGCSLPSYDRALWAPRTWLDSWSCIGHVTVGMARQRYVARDLLHDRHGALTHECPIRCPSCATLCVAKRIGVV